MRLYIYWWKTGWVSEPFEGDSWSGNTPLFMSTVSELWLDDDKRDTYWEGDSSWKLVYDVMDLTCHLKHLNLHLKKPKLTCTHSLTPLALLLHSLCHQLSLEIARLNSDAPCGKTITSRHHVGGYEIYDRNQWVPSSWLDQCYTLMCIWCLTLGSRFCHQCSIIQVYWFPPFYLVLVHPSTPLAKKAMIICSDPATLKNRL